MFRFACNGELESMNAHEQNARRHYPDAVEVCWLPTEMARAAAGVLDGDGEPLGYGATKETAWEDASRTCEHEKELLWHWPQ